MCVINYNVSPDIIINNRSRESTCYPNVESHIFISQLPVSRSRTSMQSRTSKVSSSCQKVSGSCQKVSGSCQRLAVHARASIGGGRRGRVPPTFQGGGDSIGIVPPTFQIRTIARHIA